MAKLRVHSFGMSLDGYGAGPSQSVDNPLGVGGIALHEWVFKTRTFHAIHANMDKDGGETGASLSECSFGGGGSSFCQIFSSESE